MKDSSYSLGSFISTQEYKIDQIKIELDNKFIDLTEDKEIKLLDEDEEPFILIEYYNSDGVVNMGYPIAINDSVIEMLTHEFEPTFSIDFKDLICDNTKLELLRMICKTLI